ncbi:MAG: glycosyltransferase [Caldisericum sp.]|uniref:glycosyltransferase n=1 Tax=Caldisericum sp. TaxID=2499687 RepID=UPI003D0A3AFA
MKALNLIDSLYAGGAESLLKNFAIEAKKYEDIQIDICTLYHSNIFEEKLKEENIKVFYLGLSFKYDFSKISRLIRYIKQNNYDIVHVHLFPADIFGAIASLFFKEKPKFIFSEHSIYNRRRDVKIYKSIDLFAYSRYGKIICVSDLVKERLVQYLPNLKTKAVVVRNAIPIEEKTEESKHKVYDVLFVGRLEKAKGVDILIKAVSELRFRYSMSLKVAVVGEGALRSEYEKLAKDLSLIDSMEFLGLRKDVTGLMKRSKLFVLPSRWEGLPMVILEAMANGIPVIATKVGGIPEVIEDGKDGIFVEPENPEELSKAILMLLDDDNLRNLISSNAYKKVKEEYSIEKYTKTLLSLYKELAK